MYIQVTITERWDGARVCDYLRGEGYSETQIRRYKFDGEITVNGAPQNVDYVLKCGDVLALRTAERLQTPSFAPEAATLLYADKYLYVALKPYNVPIHPDRAHPTGTFGNMLATAFGDGFKLRLVTRLDKTTDGVVLGALDEVTAERLNAMQRRGEIDKTYTALVEGRLPQTCGEIALPLLRVDELGKTVVDNAGKPSLTLYRALGQEGGNSLVRLLPKSGRTHQLRAHMAAIGNPIVGDELYGAQPATRIMLHCSELTFAHPYSGKSVHVAAAPDFLSQK